jgi:hypothetical protein
MIHALNRRPSFVVISIILLTWVSISLRVQAQTPFTVNSTADDVTVTTCDATTCTLRGAITNANATAGTDTITFNLSSGPTTITLTGALPNITEAVVVDGFSQPPGAFCDTPLITLNGAGNTGIVLATSGATIRGLSITGFAGDAISIDGSTNTINCNTILSNSGNGISVGGAASGGNQITQNRIISNGADGVIVTGAGSAGNRITGNSINGNAQLGIDLGNDGVTTNDTLDQDGGPNTFQNYPTLQDARIIGPNVVLRGTFNGAANVTLTLDVYSSAICSSQLFGQGETLIDSRSITTDAQGGVSFTINNLPLVAAGRAITTIVTSAAGDTSEFSRCVTVFVPAPRFNGSPPPGGIIDLVVVQGPANRANQSIVVSNTGVGDLVLSSYTLSGDSRISVTGPATPATLPDTGISTTFVVSCSSLDIPSPIPVVIGTLTINHNATGSPAVYTIRCQVVANATPIFTSAPFPPGAAIDFGNVLIGGLTPTNLTIFNIGTARLDVSAINLVGPNATEFRFSPALPFSLDPPPSSAALSMVLACAPLSDGFKTATLQFTTNDPRRTIAYGLTCIGSSTVVPTATPGGVVPTSPFATSVVPTALGPAQANVIEVEGLAVRSGPYLGATLLGRIVPGTNYDILASNADEGVHTWYYIKASETLFGWVSGRYLRLTGNIAVVPAQGSVFDQIDNAPETGVTAIANAIIDIRRRPSTRTTIIGQLPPNGTFSIIGRTRQNRGDFWLQVRYNGVVGWIPASPIDIRGSTSSVPVR